MNLEKLKAKLDPSNIAKREGSQGKMLDYIEGWFAIDQANEIFGFDGWTCNTVSLKEIARYEVADKYNKVKTKVCYKAKVAIAVEKDGKYIVREGSGTGKGLAADLYDAMELGIKEAETDAMKRAFRTFGNQFGNCLYDKAKDGVGDEAKKERTDAFSGAKNGYTSTEIKKMWKQIKDDLEACTTIQELSALWTENKANLVIIKQYDEQSFMMLEDAKEAMKSLLGREEVANGAAA